MRPSTLQVLILTAVVIVLIVVVVSHMTGSDAGGYRQRSPLPC